MLVFLRIFSGREPLSFVYKDLTVQKAAAKSNDLESLSSFAKFFNFLVLLLVDPNAVISNPEILFTAIRGKKEKIAKSLISMGIDVNYTEKKKHVLLKPIHEICFQGLNSVRNSHRL